MIISRLSRLFWQLSLLVGLLLSVLILLIALWFPKLPEYQPQIEQWLSTILEQPITIGNLTTYWAGFMPVVALQQVRLLDTSGKQTVVEIAEAEIIVNLFASIQHRSLITDSLTLNGSQFTLARHRDGSISLVGLPKKESSNNSLFLLLQQQHISLQATTVTWLEPEPPPLIFSNLKLTLERQDNSHKITGQVNLPQHPFQGLQAKTFRFESQLTLENRHQLTRVQGQFAFEQLQFVPNFSQTAQYPSKKSSQTLSGEFQAYQQTEGTWQIDLKKQLASFDQKPWLTHQIQAKIVPVAPKTATQNHTISIELNGSIKKLPLDKLMSVLPPELSKAAHSELPDILTATQGTLHDIQWKVVFQPRTNENMTGNPVSSKTLSPPPFHWQLQAGFTDLSTPPVGPIPDITGLAGHIELEPNKGTLSFEKTAVTLKLSDQYTYPLWLELKGAIHWQRHQQQLTVTMKQLQAIDKQTNMTVQVAGHLDFPLEDGMGMVNKQLSVTLRNGQLSQLLKYLPEQSRLPNALHPLTTAQLSGQLSQAELQIKGRGEQTRFELNGDINQLSLSNYPISDQLKTSVTINNLSGHLNIQPEQGTLELLKGTVTLNMPSQYQQPLSLAQLKGNIDWKRTQNQWQITTQQLQAIDNQMTIQASGQISIPLLGSPEYSQLSITLHNGQLSQLPKYLPKQFFQKELRQLQQAQLGGQLSQAHIKILLQKGQQTHFQFNGQIDQLSVTNYQLPGANKPTITINDLSAQLNLKPNHGALRLFKAAITLNLPSTHSQPISLTQLTGTLRWQREQKQWHITTKNLQAVDQTMTIKVSGGIEIPQQGVAPKTDLKVILHNGQLSQIPRYLPDQKWRKMAHWFNNAELQGDLSTAHIIIQGFPNTLLDKGRFELTADLNNAHLNYAQGWPSLSQLKAQLIINGRTLTVTAESGQLLDSNLQQMIVKIPDLSAPRLNLVGRTQGPAADGVRFVQQSPLHESVNLNRLEMDGLLDVQIQLDLPFSKDPKKHPKKVQVLLTFQETTLHDKSLKLTLTDVAGTVNFSEDQVLAEQMQGQLLGEPISFSVITFRNKHPKRTTVQINGFANPHGLAQQLTQINPQLAQLPLHTVLSGRTHWFATLNFPNEKVPGNNYTDIQLKADLLGMAIKLPAPLGKTADEQQPLSLSVRLFSEPEAHKSPIDRKNRDNLAEKTKRVGEEVLGTIQIRYGDRLNGLFRLNKTGLERGTLILGTTPAKLPKQAILNIEGHTSNLSITEWLTQFKAQTPNTTNQPSSTPHHRLPITILTDIQLDRFELPGQTFNKVALQAKLAPERWQASITGNGIEGQLSFDPSQKVPSLDLNFKQLTLTLPKTATATTPTEPKQVIPPNPRHLITLSFHCSALQIGDIQLGKVDLQIQPDSEGLQLNLQAINLGTHLQAKGQWRYVAQRHQTILQATLNSDRIDLMLQQFGLKKSPIIGEQAQITLNTYWPGAPYQFQLSTLVGTLSLVILEGQLVDIEPGPIGRAFGLFDVYTLPRRIALDFSDVFDKGFGFSALVGVFFIKEGRANTEHLILQAPVARISISGQTHLIEKYYDQTVTIFPQLTNPLPIAGLLAGGLSGGIAALLVQLLLQPELEQVINFQYHITGPWKKPKIAPIPR